MLHDGEFECKKCGCICCVDGDCPKFYAWCDECGDYATGFDGNEYAVNYVADIADRGKDGG